MISLFRVVTNSIIKNLDFKLYTKHAAVPTNICVCVCTTWVCQKKNLIDTPRFVLIVHTSILVYVYLLRSMKKGHLLCARLHNKMY